MAGRLVAGMDLGSTGMKLLIHDDDGAELVVEEVPTPWRAGPGGTADLPPERLTAAVGQLLDTASRKLATLTNAPVAALAIAGMGETGMVVDASGKPVAPAFAWFDPRGAAQVAALPAEVRDQFAGRTGLPLGSQASIAKLAYLREHDLAAAKSDLVRYLANSAPAILLDPEIALPAIVDDGTLARGTALVVGMDASGYETVDGLRYTKFVPGVTARRARELGGDVAKMLFYVRPDRQGADSAVAEQIRGLVRDCAEEGILLIVELLTYRLDGESDDAYRAAFPGLVADGARLAVACGAKTLKLQYPGSAEGCAAVTAAADGVPWAVLSAGVDHATFLEQVRTAMANGASGAMAGRSLWKDSLSISAATRQDYLTTRALPRLRELAAVVDGRTA